MPDLKRYDAHLVAGLLKAYFIELPEPLFTFALYDSFIAAAGMFVVALSLSCVLHRSRTAIECCLLFLILLAITTPTRGLTTACDACV